MLALSLLITACGNKTPENTDVETEISPTQQETTLPSNALTMTCPEAIQHYLDNADLKGQWKAIQAGNNITVDYVGRLDTGTVFDTSVESIAQACGTYHPGRNYSEGLTFDVGAKQMIAGFDAGVVGMKVGQTKTITIPAAEAYGEVREDLIQTYPLSDLPNPDDFQEGMQIGLGYGTTATIIKKTNTDITIDMNHELAGKALIFDITIKSIN